MSEIVKTSNGNTRKKAHFRRMQGPQTQASISDKSNNGDDKNKNKTWSLKGENGSGEDGDEEVCLICAEKLVYGSLTPCQHKTCYKCAFRQRALYEKKTCLICRTENDLLQFTDDIDAEYTGAAGAYSVNEKYNIAFANKEIENVTLNLLKFVCPLCKKNEEEELKDFGSYKKLKDHLTSSHNKTICMICASNKHAFLLELKLFTPNQLRNHQSRGDSKGFAGHPLCAFCHEKRFYSDDELYMHMRNHHEKCHICDKLQPGSPQYFRDYDQLFEHFRTSHYICSIQSCLNNKFVVFGDEFELQAHILQEHGSIIKGKPKLFQSELSTFIPTPSRVIRNRYVTNNPNGNDNESLIAEDSPEVKRLRLDERARHYLNNSQESFDRFTSLNEQYDSNQLSPTDLLASYESLFTSDEANVFLLIHNLADTYSIRSNKYKELNAIYEAEEQRIARSLLPSLNSEPHLSSGSGIWSGVRGSAVVAGSGRNLNTANLPTLQLKPASFDVFGSQKKPASFKSLTKKTIAVKKVVRSTPTENSVNYSPSYLNKTNVSTNMTSSSSSSSLSSVSGTSTPQVNSRGKDKLSSLNLESLPTPKPRVYIPPIHKTKIPNPKNWGKEPAPVQHATNGLESLLISSGNSKKKGKQKQLLFHIGI